MTRARTVAIVHVCSESVGILFCLAWGCFWAAMFAIPSSSTVACCCKQRRAYVVWSYCGGFACFLHAITAVTEALGDEETGHAPNGFICMVQIALCLISMSAVHYGLSVVALLRESVSPTEMQVGEVRVTTHPVPYAQTGLSP